MSFDFFYVTLSKDGFFFFCAGKRTGFTAAQGNVLDPQHRETYWTRKEQPATGFFNTLSLLYVLQNAKHFSDVLGIVQRGRYRVDLIADQRTSKARVLLSEEEKEELRPERTCSRKRSSKRLRRALRVWTDVTARLTFVNSVVPASCSKQALPSWRRYDEAVLIPRTHVIEVWLSVLSSTVKRVL